MNWKMTRGELWFQGFLVIFISLICVMMVYPFLHVFSISLSTTKEAIRPGLHVIPLEVSFDAYKNVFATDGIWQAFYNTIFRTAAGTALSLLFMTMAAYGLGKRYLPHRVFWTMFFVFTMFFSGGLIPTFLLVKSLGLYDTRWALIIPVMFNTFSMLIMRNFFMNLPEDLEESAKIDGANELTILYRIIVPLSKPILATIALWTAVYHWNEWFIASIYNRSADLTVLQILLRRLIVQNITTDISTFITALQTKVIPETIKSAVLMVTTLPILLFYPFLQKYFVKGILIGSLKG